MAEDDKKLRLKVNQFEITTPNGGTISFNGEGAAALLQAYQMYVQITSDFFPKAHKSVLREMEHQEEINPAFEQGYKLFKAVTDAELSEK